MTATLERYMTHFPHTIRIDEPLAAAAKLMRDFGVRHLPVLEAGVLVGVLSERDLLGIPARAQAQTKVSDVFIEGPFAVDIETSLDVVAREMAAKKIGSAIVLDQGKVSGIFTAVDACRALADVVARYER